MSGAGKQSGAAESAMEIEAKAAGWLREKHFESWNDGREAAFAAWRAESVAHQVACVRLEAAWDKTARINAIYRPMRAVAGGAEKSRWKWAAMAALVVLAVPALVMFAKDTSQPAERIFSTPVGGHETVSFADGSQIDLNTNTVLRTRISATSRLVILERGEAYFRIKHDASHPFVAMVAGHRVTDLGTKFLIRNEANRLEVALVEGRARFDAQDRNVRPISVELRPGDVVVAKSNEISLTRKPAPIMAHELGWRHGVVVFDNTTLANAAEEFNRYSTTKLVIAGQGAASLKINGTFQIDNLEAFAETAQDALDLKLERQSNKIVVSR